MVSEGAMATLPGWADAAVAIMPFMAITCVVASIALGELEGLLIGLAVGVFGVVVGAGVAGFIYIVHPFLVSVDFDVWWALLLGCAFAIGGEAGVLILIGAIVYALYRAGKLALRIGFILAGLYRQQYGSKSDG